MWWRFYLLLKLSGASQGKAPKPLYKEMSDLKAILAAKQAELMRLQGLAWRPNNECNDIQWLVERYFTSCLYG